MSLELPLLCHLFHKNAGPAEAVLSAVSWLDSCNYFQFLNDAQNIMVCSLAPNILRNTAEECVLCVSMGLVETPSTVIMEPLSMLCLFLTFPVYTLFVPYLLCLCPRTDHILCLYLE
ncbi:rCG30337 [Rattus norvegicus]|uniref:RCG30337 n=1 Tax=Rattus norvegicus TaxID=10116 RepID=A6IMF3_RAT|nr:rCG30337 [Rattus norvegicus]